MTCKGNCGYAAMADTLVDAVKIYLGKECDYPWEKYSERMIESILLEALYDFMNTATRPGYELRQLFYQYPTHNPTLSERICTMFQLTQVKKKSNGVYQYMNGFTDVLIKQSESDLK
jgi:hypothetical protein